MEALEFLKEAKRMCLAIGFCSDCKLGYGCALDGVKNLPDIALESNCLVVEQWSKDHPIITNAQMFKEVFGLEPYNDRCPPFATNDYCKGRNCSDCKSWWDEPYKEDKE